MDATTAQLLAGVKRDQAKGDVIGIEHALDRGEGLQAAIDGYVGAFKAMVADALGEGATVDTGAGGVRLRLRYGMTVQTRPELGNTAVHLGLGVGDTTDWPDYRGIMLEPAEARQLAAALVALAGEIEGWQSAN